MQPPPPVRNLSSPNGMFTYDEAQSNSHMFEQGYTYYWDAASGSYVPQSQGGVQPIIDTHLLTPGISNLQSGSNLTRWRRHRRAL